MECVSQSLKMGLSYSIMYCYHTKTLLSVAHDLQWGYTWMITKLQTKKCCRVETFGVISVWGESWFRGVAWPAGSQITDLESNVSNFADNLRTVTSQETGRASVYFYWAWFSKGIGAETLCKFLPPPTTSGTVKIIKPKRHCCLLNDLWHTFSYDPDLLNSNFQHLTLFFLEKVFFLHLLIWFNVNFYLKWASIFVTRQDLLPPHRWQRTWLKLEYVLSMTWAHPWRGCNLVGCFLLKGKAPVSVCACSEGYCMQTYIVYRRSENP